ncbi:ceramide-1-phosphate transfer protein [Cheilinus undulatus]|uniref:ceramide-1-phosphate transfer protein n=1 Tax=Cheilinus undulatus TaxID=241271 RepID=UPI001BD34703|nr:ceramide-1-phosphate transfer protein [Cheilinus undulatus]
MVFLKRTMLRRFLIMSAMLAMFLFITSFWLPQGRFRDCGGPGQPCLSFYQQMPDSPLVPAEWVDLDKAPAIIKDCPGQSFQARLLLQHLKSSLADADDVLLEPYLQSWDQLLNFMESLGTMVSFFSQKVKEKVVLIRELSLKHSLEAHGKRGPSDHSGLQTPESFGLKKGVREESAYRSVRSMVEAELKEGVVDFSRRTDSGCRTLLRLHRSLLWLRLMLEGLAEGPDADGQFKTPGELSRDAYKVALAPHHPWMLRQAAELVFLALPDRRYFLQLVCVTSQREATPVLRIVIHALKLVHTQTQKILAEQKMLELP